MGTARTVRIVLASVAFAALMITGPSVAKNLRHQAVGTRKPVSTCVAPNPSNVRAGDKIIGRDPDPFIRGEILRNFYSGWPTAPVLGDACR